MEQKNLRKELEAQIIGRALKDENFRLELIRDPKSVLEKELGAKIPDSVTVRILEEKEGEICLIIPQVSKKEDELTEIELESVAGGTVGLGPGWTMKASDCGPSDCAVGGPL